MAKSGVERIEIKEGKFYYLKEVGGRGIPMILAVEKLYKFKYAPETEKGLWNDINRSIWMVGGEVIDFPANGKLARLGMKLTKQEAEKVADLINKTANL